VNISKELFIETINFIKERNDAQNKIDKLFRKEFTDGLFWPYCRYETQIVKVLEEIMGDKENQWISYYCWEKDYGRDERLGYPTNKDGKVIPLATPEDLWNLLISNEKDS
jgi:hypothetical protein